MRFPRLPFSLSILLLLSLLACTPSPSGTSQPTLTVQGGSPATPSQVPINLTGPEMKVGSSWLYADGAMLVAVPAGIYTRGHGGPDDPVKQVNISDFWIYRTKVTNAQYAYCVSQGQCTSPNKTDDPGYADPLQSQNPVVGVDYTQAAAYCTFVHARLPTEAEWEKTARGLDANIYPWGNGAPSCDLLNYESCQGKTTPVNNYPQGQSYYTAFDMEGNAFEWAADWYQQDYYLIAPPDDPPGPERGFARVVRSSAFNSGTNQTQTYNRFHSGPADHRPNLGFRCVVEDPTYYAPYCNYPATYGTDGIGGGSVHGSVDAKCPLLSINQVPGCQGDSPVTTVTLQDVPALPQQQALMYAELSGSCTDAVFPTYVCHSDGYIKVCDQCSVIVKTPPQCPDGYTWNSQLNTCTAGGRPGACLPGTAADAAGQCCTFESGSAVSTAQPSSLGSTAIFIGFPPNDIQIPGCPAGTWPYTGGPNPECIAFAFPSPYCKTVGIDLASCTGGDNKCHLTCTPPDYVDETTCTCQTP